MAHTPGPWTLEYNEYAGYDMMSGGWVVKSSTGWIVVMDCNKDDAKGKADALLIAAAPDLLAALRRVERVLKTSDTWYLSEQHKVALAAIVKATGE
jgi:hypothetical protein